MFNANLAWILLWVGLCTCLGAGPAFAQSDMPLEAGMATVNITPKTPAQVPLAGYISRLGQTAQGVHDPIFCQALVLRQTAQETAVVSCDLVGISAILRQKVSQKLAPLGIRSENLMLTATHTHSGPGGFHDLPLFAAGFGTYQEAYTELIASEIVSAVKKARLNSQKARVKLGHQPVYDLIWNRRDPYAAFDHGSRRFQHWAKRAVGQFKPPVLSTIWFESLQGIPFAVVFHLPMHNTVYGADNVLLSADWAGVARRELANQRPGLQALYLNGAEADLTPIMLTNQQSDQAYLEQIGQKVAQRVLAQAAESSEIELAAVKTGWQQQPLPMPHLLGIPLSNDWTQGYFETMPLQLLDFGALTLLAVPLELTAQAGENLRQLALDRDKTYPLVVGLANDYMFYCTLPEEQEAGGYEVLMTLFGPSEFELIRAGFEVLLKHPMSQSKN